MSRMMQQYHDAKAAYPGMLVLFRNGDFYELFEDDAELGARVLGLTLTKRDKEIPMAGVPAHRLEHYLGLLVRAGHKVAVCEQLEPPDPKKKIIPREVNRVVTPGTVTEDALLDPRAPNHLAALLPGDPKTGTFGLAWADLSAGSFLAADVPSQLLADELARLNPAELLFPEPLTNIVLGVVGGAVPPRAHTPRPGWEFDPATASAALKTQFGVATFAGFGFTSDDAACLTAAGGLILYLQQTLKSAVPHLRPPRPHRADRLLALDEVTRRSLELVRTLRDNSRDGSVLGVLDRTVTAMGARLLHDSLLAPLADRDAITARLDAVGEWAADHPARGGVRDLLGAVADLQRLTARVATGRANPPDAARIAGTLVLLPPLKAKLSAGKAAVLAGLGQRLDPLPDLLDLLTRAVVDRPPAVVASGGAIKTGFSPELDELRNLTADGKAWIARYQAQEVTRTGINSLKVGFNDVHGYYIEITNANATRVPADYTRKQTLKNAERYITPPLKEYEEKVLTAQERALALEAELFQQVLAQIAARAGGLLAAADVLASADFLAGLAELAADRGYVRPTLTDAAELHVVDGRHPVLDVLRPAGTVVPNDLTLDDGPGGRVWLVTGPNMSGKSTFIRQAALVTLLAHVGCFVPASAARVGLTDRIFTRVGAGDDLARGRSTFLVEMSEAANILNNATPRSLVILDEVGRGTSTYDGLALAWAITEHLHDVAKCRTLFATHYHELSELAASLPGLRNYHVQVQELDNEVVFLHRLAPGAAGKSYGIHVARLAGVPEAVLSRATAVLDGLETRNELPAPVSATPKRHRPRPRPAGPTLFGDDDPAAAG